MPQVHGEIIITRPVEDVFSFVADERNEPRYNHEMVRCELVTEEPIGQGSRFQAEMSMRGKPVQMAIEFTDFQRPRLLASASHLSTMEIEGRLTFDPVPGGTRMTWDWELHPKGALKLLSPLVARMGRSQEERIWTELKHVLEAPAARA
jgi:uncharacterized protein YndB with AHSA1/START domain